MGRQKVEIWRLPVGGLVLIKDRLTSITDEWGAHRNSIELCN